jgi:hypothetical protein
MPQPAATPINPFNPAQPRGGKPSRKDDLALIIVDLQTRVSALENLLAGGLVLTSPDGKTTVRLTIDNTGNPIWTKQ